MADGLIRGTAGPDPFSVAYVESSAAGQPVQFSDFTANSGNTGLLMPSTGLIAPGVTYSMRAKSSTKAAKVPAPVTGLPNTLRLMRSVAGVTGAKFSGFTLQATDQGHYYGGITFDHQTNATVDHLTVRGVPGYQHFPPGETSLMESWHGLNEVFSDIEVDGQGVGACNFAANSSTNITVNRLNAHDCPYSRPAFWLTNGVTLNDLTSVNNWGGINLEQCSGPIRINRPVLKPLDAVRAGGASGSGMHLHLDNIALDNKDIVITDPDTGGVPFRMMIVDSYKGGQSQTTMPTILRNGVPLIWLDANKNNGWGVALKDPLKYAVRFH